ncbi:ABC transporter substrate-binding protein [Nordella sp. HKS 07]|uniref:ABC transporter substrate-binding protein n=1 Tax=Nordella sp. HKS 07 TaxID=2712222 RepID=UPI0013E1CC10|nr:ABC transporter substrate-binding protein [Nordella sp. HKS 07]QIG49261.1 ABC transporter substrate-binding protein [Nordella sp. HKS 07]
MDEPRRLLSLAPNVSMILFALGADDVVVGRTSLCLPSIRDYLEIWGFSGPAIESRLQHWAALPEVGGWPSGDCERAKALRPDMILASATGPLAAHENWPAPSVNFDIRTLADIDRQITAIGEILGKPQAAREMVAQLAVRRESVLARRSVSSRRPTVLFEYCVCIKYHPEPACRFANPGRFIMAGGYLAPELIRMSGGEPLFVKPGDAVAWIDFQDIREAQPDVILAFDCNGCPNSMKHPIAARPGWPDLKAVANSAVYRPRRNLANPNLCHPEALAELADLLAAWAER